MGPRRRLLLLAVVVAALVGGVLWALPRGGDEAPTAADAVPSATVGGIAEGVPPTATPTGGSSTPPAPVTPEPSGPTEVADEPPPSRPAVSFDGTAESADGVTATVQTVEAVEGTGFGPGNIAGPALRVTVRVSNGTSAPVPLDGAVVRMTHGETDTPASPLEDPSRAPFSGTVAPGDTADGVYVFRVPEDQRQRVTVVVGHQAGAPLMVFTGPVG
ncbi:hypothetical protein [Geodermatophilus sp. SYSU D01036]